MTEEEMQEELFSPDELHELFDADEDKRDQAPPEDPPAGEESAGAA
jgi:hypothetical protein